jgi:hypothetical protein
VAKYTGAIYRGAYYGQTPRLVLSAEPMSAVALDYGQVSVQWTPPQGTFYKFRLVRNNDNFPESEQDGVVLYEQASTTNLSGSVSRNSFIDGVDNFLDSTIENNVPIASGQFIYYAVWLFTSANIWVLSGRSYCLMPKDKGTQKTLFNLLPKVYTSPEQSPTGISDPSSDLYNFLQPFSFTYDQLLTYSELLAPSYGKKTTPPQLINLFANQLGMEPENGLPYKNRKKLIREASYLYKGKGTELGIKGYTESLTTWSPTLTISPNLMLDVQDSSFYKSIGRWTKTYGTLTSVSNKVGPTGTNAIDRNYSGRFVTAVSVVTFRERTNNVAKLTVTEAHGLVVGDTVNITGVETSFNASGVTVASIPTATSFTYANSAGNIASTASTGSVSNTSTMSLGRNNPVLNGIPVQPSTSYEFAYHAASDSNGALIADIFWYDYLGVQISTSVQGTSLGTTGVYQRQAQTATSPATAVYAGIRFVFTSQNSYNIDMIQFAPTATASTFDEARALDLFVTPRFVNILRNPSFETNSTGWTTNSSTTRDTDTIPAGLPGSYSLRLSGQTSLSLSTICNTLPTVFKLTQGNWYVFSLYMKASAASNVTLTLVADDDDSTSLESGTKVVPVTTSWARQFVQVYVPEGLSVNNNITVTFTLTGTVGSGVNFWVDNAQFEQAFKPTDYFDGSLPQASGVFWSGTAHASYSYRYDNWTIKMARLLNTLKYWVPMNSPWRVRSYKGLEGTSATFS